MAEGYAYVQGSYCPLDEAKISVFDLGFTHSDVVYDVTSAWLGRFFRLDEHIARFERSCSGIRLTCPYGARELKTILATCVQRGGVAQGAYVSLVLTRGRYATPEAARARDILRTVPTFLAYAVPYRWIAEPQRQERGVRLIVSTVPRIPSASVDMRYKNFHWGDLTAGCFEANAAGADVAVHCAVEGYLTEGAGFNLFFVRGGRLYTPRHNVLEGVTRQAVLDIAAESGLPAVLGDFAAQELRDADEAFITSTAGGIMPVVRADDRPLGAGVPGPLSQRLREEYWRRREAGWMGTPVADLLAPGEA